MTTGPGPAPPPDSAGAARTARHVRATLERALEALEEAAARVRAGADDEAVHDLRVASRRLTARLDFWRPLLRRRRAARARLRLRALRRRLGPARELEAGVAMLRLRIPELPPATREALQLVIAALETRMPGARQAAAATAAHPRLARIRRSVQRATRDVELRSESAGDIDARVAEEIGARRDTARAQLVAAMLGRDDPALHAARIAAKRWRYGLECARDLAQDLGESGGAAAPASPRFGPDLKRLRALQDALGAVQDVAGLRTMLEAEAGRLVATGQPAHAAALHPAFDRLAAIRAEAIANAEAIVPGLEASGA